MKHLLFFLFLLLCSFSLSARHILGGTISYKRLGASANTIFYELSFELYRDCGVGNPDFDIPLQEVCIFKNDSLFQSLSIEMVGSPVMVATSPYSMCIEKVFYRTTISLPPSSYPYKIIYQRCCRNNILMNIEAPGDNGFSLYTTIPATNIINSSPQFSNTFPFLGGNLQFSHNIIANDIDADSIVQVLTLPKSGGSSDNPVPTCNTIYTTPYDLSLSPNFSLQNILNSTTPLSITSTGLLFSSGNNIGHYAFGIDTKEYRNGVLINTTHNEFSLYIIANYLSVENNFYNMPFSLSPNPAQDILTINIADSQELTYTIFSLDGKKMQTGTNKILDISTLDTGFSLLFL